MSPQPNHSCSVPFLAGQDKADEEPIMEPQSPNVPLIQPAANEDTPLRLSASLNNMATHNSSRRSSKHSGILPPDFLHQFILEPKLEEQKAFTLAPIDDDESTSSSSAQTIPSNICPQVLAAISVSLGSMVVGLISAYTSTAIPSLVESDNSSLHIVDKEGEEVSWIGSLMPLGALTGSVIGGFLVEMLGRKTTLLAITLPFIISWLMIAMAEHIWMLYIARAIEGISVGIASLCLPVYLAETVQPEVRGTLGLLPTTIGNIGLLISFTAGTFLNWRNLAYLCAGLSLPFLVLMFFIPETPRWYIAHGKEKKAEKALQWLRGSAVDVRAELQQIKNTHVASTKQTAKLKDLLGYAKPLFISLGLMLFQQFSGINAVIFYGTHIFELAGSSLDPHVCTIIIGVANFGATFMANLLIDRLGRKVLLLISDVFMIVSLGVLGGFFYLHEHHKEQVESFGWAPLASLIVYVIAFSLGFGPVPWLMLGEIFPGKIRGSAAAAATAFNWICCFTVTKVFPSFLQTFGADVTFLCFAAICLLGLAFIVLVVPETQGQSLDDIERHLTRPFRRLSSTANLKPSPMFM